MRIGTPAASARSCMRDRGGRVGEPAATSATGHRARARPRPPSPRSRTWCAPRTPSRAAGRPPWRLQHEVGRSSSSSSRASQMSASARGAAPRAGPRGPGFARTRPGVASSSAFETARPGPGGPRGARPSPGRSPRGRPRCSAWASPTFVIIRRRDGRSRRVRRCSRGSGRPSRARDLRVAAARQHVSGSPNSLLNEPRSRARERRPSAAGGEVLGRGLARRTGDPDHERAGQPLACRRTQRRRTRRTHPRPSPIAAPAGGRSATSRVTSATVAPRLKASATKSWPSPRVDERDEARTGRERAGVVGPGPRARVVVTGDRPAPRDLGDLAGGQLHPSAPSSARATRRSSNGTTVSPVV